MQISAIVAMSTNRVIGKNNQLPWHLPADLHHFKRITLGKPIIMGRKTYESIGRPLPDRLNIVVTRDSHFQAPGCLIVTSIEEALTAANEHPEIVIIGGALLFEEMLPRIQRLYLTLIHETIEGDTFFPAINEKEWDILASEDHLPDEKNRFSYTFLVMERKQG